MLQAAAVIGKEFPQPVLERVVELEPAELEDALRNLVAGEFVYEQELYPEALYAFKHPLTQEVAYGSQLGERRAAVHAAVARAIAEQYPERLDERAALLAQHWEAAGETLEAARWHARAAAWSGTSDPTQALRHWRKVRELADALPESAETVALGLDGEDLLARVRLAARDLARGGGGRCSTRRSGWPRRPGTSARGRSCSRAYGAVRGLSEGDVREYARLARQAIALAEESGDPALYVAVATVAYALYCIGEYREGVAICDRAIELADGDPTVGAGIDHRLPLRATATGSRG